MAFSLAAETAKQFIGFSIAIITLTVTFAKDTLVSKGEAIPKSLAACWLLLLVCIVSGIGTFQALVAAAACNGSVSDPSVTLMAVVMYFSFIGGSLMLVAAGWRALSTAKEED